MSIRSEDEIQIETAVFRVKSGDEKFWVIVEIQSKGSMSFVCSCGLKDLCDHIKVVKNFLSQFKFGSQKSFTNDIFSTSDNGSDNLREISLSSVSNVSLSTPESKSEEKISSEIKRVHDAVENFLNSILNPDGLDKETVMKSAELISKDLKGFYATDLLKSVSSLRRAVLKDTWDSIEICVSIERVEGALKILKRYINGEFVQPNLLTSFVGRRKKVDDLPAIQEIRLIEVARNSVLTPFGIRRSESFYLSPSDGEIFMEEKYHPVAEGNPSIGPFPRNLWVNLMAVEDGPWLKFVRILQYSVLKPLSDADFARIKTFALPSVEECIKLYKSTVEKAGSPYPVFIIFAPIKVSFSEGKLIMQDHEENVLGLAYLSSPDNSSAVEKICRTKKLHAISGMLIREGRFIVLSPMSVLIEDESGLKIIRIT